MTTIRYSLQIIFIFALAFGVSFCNRPPQLFENCLKEGDPISIKIFIMNGSNQVINYTFPLLYTLQQPEESTYLNVTVHPQMDNLTIVAQLWPQNSKRPISRTTKNLTRYAKIRGSLSATATMEMDVGVSEKVDQNTKYGLQIPVRFKMLILYIDHPVPYAYEYFKLFGFTLFNRQGSQCYAVPIDLSQMHIPFKSYKSIADLNHTQSHQILFMSKVYSIIYYQMFYGFTNVQFLKSANPLLAQIYTQETVDLIKETMFDNNFYLVLFYFTLNFIQVFMQIFAFKNEIKVWKSIEKNAGLSIKVLYQNLVCSIIVCLYLHDKQANRLFFLFQIIDLLMVIWKLTRAIKVTVSLKNRFIIKFQYKQWYHRKVQSVDTEAIHYTNYLIAILYSLFMIYKLYPVAKTVYGYYQKDLYPPLPSLKQIYSFVLESSVMFIFVLGFVMMTPQLYINYKLKSVDHLPWKTLIYRFISTIIDDIFVFMIELPWLQRMFSFRDDVIFVLYLIQRKMYKVDKNRVAVASGSISIDNLKKQEKAIEEQPTHIKAD